MILKAFSEYIQKNTDKNPIENLYEWIKITLEKIPKTHVEKIIHTEIYIAKNKHNCTLLIGKSETGRKLIEILYNFALSYEQQEIARKIHKMKPNDFKNCKK